MKVRSILFYMYTLFYFWLEGMRNDFYALIREIKHRG